MAQEKAPDSNSLMETLGSLIGEKIEAANKKKEPIPAVYSSGMRGSEVPPNLRNKDQGVKDAKAAGMRKGVDPQKVKNAQGKKVVQFDASKESKAKQIARLQKENEKLKAAVAEKKKIKI